MMVPNTNERWGEQRNSEGPTPAVRCVHTMVSPTMTTKRAATQYACRNDQSPE